MQSPLLGISLPHSRSFFHEKLKLNRNSYLSGGRVSYRRFVTDGDSSETYPGFSVLKTDAGGDIGSVWSSMGFYVLSIHVPLSFGGLSAAAKILHQPLLNPQTQAFVLLGIQTLELSIVLQLLKCPGKPQYDLQCFFSNKSSKGRSLLLATVLGFGFLLSLVFITSYFAERLTGSEDLNNNSSIKEILSSGSSSIMCCFLVYCIVTPVLEEVVYRGFFLTSLASKMKWQEAVAISSLVFSAAHFSSENFLQLVIVGIVLGCSYCWTGNLVSPLLIHSLYNSLILISALLS